MSFHSPFYSKAAKLAVETEMKRLGPTQEALEYVPPSSYSHLLPCEIMTGNNREAKRALAAAMGKVAKAREAFGKVDTERSQHGDKVDDNVG